MKIIYHAAAMLIAGFLVMPNISLAQAPKTLTGVIKGFNGSQIIFQATSAAKYSAEVGSAQLTRKNGVAMQLSEFLIGDKIEVTGTLWADNSVSATSVRDLSLYTHIGTFSGKISAINTTNASFTMDSKTYGSQTIHTTNFTSYTKNGSGAAFNNLILGMTASVKGVWDRSNQNITAMAVSGTYRLIDIYFTGTLTMKSNNSLTVVGNGNVIYGVDVSGATLQNKNGKTAQFWQYTPGDVLRVWGKHISGSVAITGTLIKDSLLSQ